MDFWCSPAGPATAPFDRPSLAPLFVLPHQSLCGSVMELGQGMGGGPDCPAREGGVCADE